VVSQAASLEVFQVASQVGEDSQAGGNSPRYHNSQRQDGLVSREEANGPARLPSSLSSHNLSSRSSQSSLHLHRHSQLLLRLRDPQ